MLTNNTKVVEAKGLTKYFADFCAVDQIDFSVHQGECFGVLGPNGAGKTTTLRMLLGQATISSGELRVLGFDLPNSVQKMRAKIGVVPQQDNLDQDFTVIENLRSYASYFGLSGAAMENRFQNLLEFVGLLEKKQSKVTALSGGMKRRLTLARSLVNDPELLILDEPTTGLDPQARQLLWQRLRGLKKQGATLILTTHYLEEAERLCDRVVVVDHGKILAHGTPSGLIREHIEAQVIEVHGEGASTWYDSRETLPASRIEMVGETVFCYADDEKPLLNQLEQRNNVEFLLRRANLEDVFLKLTGRELRDG